MNGIREIAYLALLGRVPLLPIEDADSAYVVFVELFNQPVPSKHVATIVGGGGEVEPLRDKGAIADSWKESIPNSSHQPSGVAYKTTTFPCSSLNRDGTLLSTCGLVVASKPRRESGERPTHLFFRRNGTKPSTPIRRNRESNRHGWWEEYMQHVTFCYQTGRKHRTSLRPALSLNSVRDKPNL